MTGSSWLHLVAGLLGVGWPCVELRAADLPGKPGTAVPADATSGMAWALPFASRIESAIAAAAAKGATELPLEIQEETRTFRFDAASRSWKPTGERTSTTLEINNLFAEDYRLRYHPLVTMWFPSAESDMDQMRLLMQEESHSKVGPRAMRHRISAALGNEPAHKTDRVELLPAVEAHSLMMHCHTFLNFTLWGMDRASGRPLAREIVGPLWTKRQVQETEDSLSLTLEDGYNTEHLVLDKRKGFAVTLREHKAQTCGAGELITCRYEIMEHEHVAEGVYLPKSAVFTEFRKDVPTRKIEYRMTALRHLETPVVLDLTFKEGTVVIDRRPGEGTRKPGR
ncbi:MAG: hypothetical protein ACAH88_11705 [Roseimicrobium sp.]